MSASDTKRASEGQRPSVSSTSLRQEQPQSTASAAATAPVSSIATTGEHTASWPHALSDGSSKSGTPLSEALPWFSGQSEAKALEHNASTLKKAIYRELMANETFECLYNLNLKGGKDIIIKPHHHAFFEIIFIVEGKLSYEVEGRTYELQAGDIIFVDAMQFHRGVVHLQHNYLRYMLWVHPNYVQRLQERFPQLDFLSSFNLHGDHQHNLLRFPVEIFWEFKALLSRLYVCTQQQGATYQVMAECLLTSILVLLIQYQTTLQLPPQVVSAYPHLQPDQSVLSPAPGIAETEIVYDDAAFAAANKELQAQVKAAQAAAQAAAQTAVQTAVTAVQPVNATDHTEITDSNKTETQEHMAQKAVDLSLHVSPLPDLGATRLSLDPVIAQLLHHINTHLADDLSLEHLAQLCNLSKFSLMRKFKQFTGMSLHQYIVKKRLLQARYLISLGMEPYRAALDAGFNNYSNFSRSFTSFFGENPGTCARRYKKKSQRRPDEPSESHLNFLQPLIPRFPPDPHDK